MLREIDWWVQSGPIKTSGVLPAIALFFWKFSFSLRTCYKELIWCTNYPIVHIHTFCMRQSFICRCFFPASILNKEVNPNSAIVYSVIIQKYIIKLSRVLRKKRARADKTDFGPKMMKWHCTLLEGSVKSGSKRPDFDQRRGRFSPSQQLNADQMRQPFGINLWENGIITKFRLRIHVLA